MNDKFTIECRGFNGKQVLREVAPGECRTCQMKKFCRSVHELVTAKYEYAKKFRGTIIESSMMKIGEEKQKLADYILGDQK